MKKRILIACTMQINLIQYIRKKYHPNLSIQWISRNLHNNPVDLRKTIQQCINENQDCDEILLSYGLCGNAVIDLVSRNTSLILPAYDDCICQMLIQKNESQDNKKTTPEKGCYYLTEEWTYDKEAIVQQCEEIYHTYGIKEGQLLINEIYGNYHTIVILENESWNSEKIKTYVQKAAEYTQMIIKKQPASIAIMKQLILGDYDEKFVIVKPGEKITWKMFKNNEGK